MWLLASASGQLFSSGVFPKASPSRFSLHSTKRCRVHHIGSNPADLPEASLCRIGVCSSCRPPVVRKLDEAPPDDRTIGIKLPPRMAFPCDRNGNFLSFKRLYHYYRTLAPELPNNFRDMEPLFSAVICGCNAGLFREALHEVYIPRIQRRNDWFAANVLGARGALLTVLVHFFEHGTLGITRADSRCGTESHS